MLTKTGRPIQPYSPDRRRAFGGMHPFQRRANYEIVSSNGFDRIAAYRIVKAIRELQVPVSLRGETILPTVNITFPAGNTMVGVFDQISRAGTVSRQEVETITPSALEIPHHFFLNPGEDNFVFRPDFDENRSFLLHPIGEQKAFMALWKRAHKSFVDWSRVRFFQMAEYLDTSKKSLSLRQYFYDCFLDRLPKANTIPADNIILLGNEEPEEGPRLRSVNEFTSILRCNGGLDIAVLSVGPNGEMAHNIPGIDGDMEYFHNRMRHVTLDKETVGFKAPASPNLLNDPHAIAMGPADLLEARGVIFLARGPEKANSVRCSLRGKVTARWPASIFRLHSNVTFIIDREAAKDLDPEDKMTIKAANRNTTVARALMKDSKIDAIMNEADKRRISLRLADIYLSRVISDKVLLHLLRSFASSGENLNQLDRFLQNEILDYFLENSSQIAGDNRRGIPFERRITDEMFIAGFRAYKFPDTEDRIKDRKRLLYNFVFIHIMSPSFSRTASPIMKGSACEQLVEQALGNSHEAIYQPALETIFEIWAAERKNGGDMFFNAFEPIMTKSIKLPGFSKAVFEMLIRAKQGKITLFYGQNDGKDAPLLLSQEEFFESAKTDIKRLTGSFPEFKKRFGEYLEATLKPKGQCHDPQLANDLLKLISQ
ncbi:MAG: 6-phosphogluconolactonase [Candidatus Margulisiibacteriota bacterium]